MKKRLSGILILSAVLFFAGCGGGGGDRGVVPDPTANMELHAINQAIQQAGAEWEAAENPISQLSQEERDRLNGALPEEVTGARVAPRNSLQAGQLPESLDWRDRDGHNWMTSIKSQGSCGSCVAFASLGVVEALMRIAGGEPTLSIDLSEAELYSCGGRDCHLYKGWRLSSAAGRLKSSGVVDDDCLPYDVSCSIQTYLYCELTNTCSDKCSDWQSRLTKIDSWNWVPQDQTSIKNYLLQGPVLAAIDVYSDFSYYDAGVYEHVTGSYRGGHAIAIVGYSDTGGYWIVKNSWGTWWGEDGYVRIKYGEIGIESSVLAMQMTETPAGVTATVSPTSVTLSGGQAQVTLTCSTNGTVSVLEGRCKSSDTWATISSGNTKVCTYTTAGTYTPGCRVNSTTTDNVDVPVTVSSASVCGNGTVETGEQCDDGNTTSGDGCSSTCQNEINVTASVSPTSGTTSNTYTLTCAVSGGTATTLEGRCKTSDSWSTISSGNTKSCTYSSAGTYTPGCRVNGTVSDNADTPVTVSTPSNQPPTASASVNPTSGVAPLTVQFTGGCTDSDGTCVSYSWNFGDGSPTSSQQSPSHTFSNAGTFTVTLTVTDDDSTTDQATITVTVNTPPNQAPTASASADVTSGSPPLVVQFTGSCTDTDGSCVSYSWDFDDGTLANSSQNPSHTFNSAGTYIVTLTVADDDGTTGQSTVTIIATGIITWAKTFGGTSLDEARSVQQTSDGGYIVAGDTKSYGAGGDYSDVWVLKLDTSGNQVWAKTFGGGTADDIANSVQQTTDGGYIVAGSTGSYGAGSYDGWVLKLDSSGNQMWEKTFGGTSDDYARSVQQTTDSGYIVAGDTGIFDAYSPNVWVLKLNSSGNQVWAKTFDTADYASSIQQTTDGGYIVAGSLYSGADKEDFWLLKLDSSGNQVWVKTFGGTGNDVAYSVQQTTDGGYIVAGIYGTGISNFWVLKLDTSGNQVWEKRLGGTNIDRALSVQQTSDGGYIVAGDTSSYGAGNTDFWVLKLDTSGNQVWEKTFGGTSYDHARSVRQTTDGGYIVAGDTFTYTAGAGYGDIWVLKLYPNGNCPGCQGVQ